MGSSEWMSASANLPITSAGTRLSLSYNVKFADLILTEQKSLAPRFQEGVCTAPPRHVQALIITHRRLFPTHAIDRFLCYHVY
jgi:hypothetical protein